MSKTFFLDDKLRRLFLAETSYIQKALGLFHILFIVQTRFFSYNLLRLMLGKANVFLFSNFLLDSRHRKSI